MDTITVMVVFLIIFAAIYNPDIAQDEIETVNKNATAEAKQLLKYLYSINGQKIIAGQHNYSVNGEQYHEQVMQITGKYPQIWGSDFINYYKKDECKSIVKNAYMKFKDGYFVTLMWHSGRPQDDPPFDWKGSIQAEMSKEEWNELITPGTNLNLRWTEQVDIIASYLKELRDLGVPVLWRPYHEMNGIWFWWGDKRGDNGFVKLWKMMYNRYVHYHKLDNLIWVWNANTPRDLKDDEAFEYSLYFPGLDYVDILAADVYHNDYKQSHHDQLLELAGGKIIALGEVGEVPTPQIIEAQPYWTWFMIWANWLTTHNSPEKIMNLYNSSRVLSHDDFSDSKLVVKCIPA